MTGVVRLALAGDTMLGRGVAEQLQRDPERHLFSPELVEVALEADLFVLNLECCISNRAERWPDPRKPFFFRAPPSAVDQLTMLGVDCVTLANNHALDFGFEALVDTLDRLESAGIAVVGAGRSLAEARAPATLIHDGFELRVIGLTDHPREYAATSDRPGVAFSDLTGGVPSWVQDAIEGVGADATLVTPHWGPNMTSSPVSRVRGAAASLVKCGATLIAGHSAHVFHGVDGNVLFDLGDFIDDYAVDPVLRNDLGLFFMVDLTTDGPSRLEAIPIALDYAHTRIARNDEAAWIFRRFRAACAEFGSDLDEVGGRMLVTR